MQLDWSLIFLSAQQTFTTCDMVYNVWQQRCNSSIELGILIYNPWLQIIWWWLLDCSPNRVVSQHIKLLATTWFSYQNICKNVITCNDAYTGKFKIVVAVRPIVFAGCRAFDWSIFSGKTTGLNFVKKQQTSNWSFIWKVASPNINLSSTKAWLHAHHHVSFLWTLRSCMPTVFIAVLIVIRFAYTGINFSVLLF